MGKYEEIAQKTYDEIQQRRKRKEKGIKEATSFQVEQCIKMKRKNRKAINRGTRSL